MAKARSGPWRIAPSRQTEGSQTTCPDESEAELQRQAEVKAAIVAQNQAEEQEFKAARQQLAYVDLRPPKSWNPLTSAGRPPAGSMSGYTGGSFSAVQYTAGAIAQQTGAQTRG